MKQLSASCNTAATTQSYWFPLRYLIPPLKTAQYDSIHSRSGLFMTLSFQVSVHFCLWNKRTRNFSSPLPGLGTVSIVPDSEWLELPSPSLPTLHCLQIRTQVVSAQLLANTNKNRTAILALGLVVFWVITNTQTRRRPFSASRTNMRTMQNLNYTHHANSTTEAKESYDNESDTTHVPCLHCCIWSRRGQHEWSCYIGLQSQIRPLAWSSWERRHSRITYCIPQSTQQSSHCK